MCRFTKQLDNSLAELNKSIHIETHMLHSTGCLRIPKWNSSVFQEWCGKWLVMGSFHFPYSICRQTFGIAKPQGHTLHYKCAVLITVREPGEKSFLLQPLKVTLLFLWQAWVMTFSLVSQWPSDPVPVTGWAGAGLSWAAGSMPKHYGATSAERPIETGLFNHTLGVCAWTTLNVTFFKRPSYLHRDVRSVAHAGM